MSKRTTAEKRADLAAFVLKKPKRRKPPLVSIWPDDCECSARDRCICTQACKPTRHKIKCAKVRGSPWCNCGAEPKQPTRISTVTGKEVPVHAAHRKHIKENRGGRDDRPAGTPGATPMRKRGPKYPLGKPLYVHMTEGRIAANAKAEAERTAAEKWHAISGFIYIHPCDFTIGKDVHWHRAGKILHGTVVHIRGGDKFDMLRPAKVLRRGPVRYHYTPSVYDYCDKNGEKPCVCDLPIGQRTECQHKDDCPVPGMKRIMSGKPVTPYDVKPTQDQLTEAREWNRWAGSRVPCGPAAGSLMYGTCVGTADLDLALALVLRRIREGGTPT